MKRLCLLLVWIILGYSTTAFAEDDFQDYTFKSFDEGEINAQLLDLAAAPSSIVGGAVNVITGNYFESHTDLIVPSANPIYIQRYFNSGGDYDDFSVLGHRWSLSSESGIKFFVNQNDRIYGAVKDQGAHLSFKGDLKRRKAKLRPVHAQLSYGITNCSSGVIGSRTNIKNKRLRYKRGATCKLKQESGEIHFFKKASHRVNYYALIKNLLPSGCWFNYEYDDGRKNLKAIKSMGGKGNLLGRVTFRASDAKERNPSLTVSTDGHQVKYIYYEKDKNAQYGLKEVISTKAPTITYEYRNPGKDKMDRLVKKVLPDNRFLKIAYFEKGNNRIGSEVIQISSKEDSRVGRVSALYAPVGNDDTPQLIWKFKYDLNKSHHSKRPIGGRTEVTDALGHRKIYHFSDEQRLTSIEHFKDNKKLYRKEKMLWEDSGDKKTFLLSRGLIDGDGNLIFRRNYTYDDYGNILKESFCGNLTGSCHKDLTWCSYRHADSYQKTYTYTTDGLLASESDDRKTTYYQYVPDTDLVKLKLIYDNHRIQERYGFEYDVNGSLVKEITEDGTSKNINDLTGVTERRIKTISYTTSKPIGLPEVIEEKFLNLSTLTEELLSKVVNSYSFDGYLIKKQIYDANGQFYFETSWEYDACGNMIIEIDPLGNLTTHEYDENNNRIESDNRATRIKNSYEFDNANRLVKEEITFSSSRKVTKSYSYDHMGNKTAYTNEFIQKTSYRYDEFGRLIEKHHPPALDRHGVLISSCDYASYDCMNNLSQTIDTNGNITRMKHTPWGKPYHIEHPDGSIETFVYDVDGTLLTSTEQNGVETRYTHDYKGRKTAEEKYSTKGDLLSSHYWIYSAYHLIEEIDPAGNRTVYTYDGAGRLESVRKGHSEIRYGYDKMGRQSEIWELYEEGKYKKTVQTFDVLNRPISERILDADDTLISKKSSKYDRAGNLVATIIYDGKDNLSTFMEYDFCKNLIKITHPDNNSTKFVYRYAHGNEQMQIVLRQEETDANGIITIRTHDIFGNLAKLEKIDGRLKKPLQRSFYRYDVEGNLLLRTDDVIVGGAVARQQTVDYVYDSMKREIEVIEAKGDPLEKVTRKEYFPSGELAKIIKPNGVILFHEYDDLHRLIAMHSSDDSIHYRYTYDAMGNIIHVEDLVQGLSTERTFNEQNLITSDLQGTGLKIAYFYGIGGRILELTLPDDSQVKYQYDAAYLRSVVRENSRDIYKIGYQFDLTGKLIQVSLPKSLGGVDYCYDNCLRPTKIESKYFLQTITEYDPCGNVMKTNQKDLAGEVSSQYTYDQLDHLVSETGIATHTYQFDSLNNRTQKDGVDYQNNIHNQLMEQNGFNYEYDPNGNQSKKTGQKGISTYQYDALDRLTAVIYDDWKIEYAYDSFNRRLKKTLLEKSNQEWIVRNQWMYLYQGDIEIGAYQNDKLAELRVLGLGLQADIGAMILLEIEGKAYCPIHDFRGNIASLVDIDKNEVIECYRYSAYGEEQLYCPNSSLKAISPWRFSSKRVDAETGWVYYGRRHYDPEIGKWTTPDPLGFVDSRNVYCFVRNRPLKYIDPDGRFPAPLMYPFCKHVVAPTLSEFIGQNYETMANIATYTWMREFNGEEYHDVAQPFSMYSQVYRVGTPKYENVCIFNTNGMSNIRLSDAMDMANSLSEMAGGHEVRGVYKQSYGVLDVVEAGLGLFGLETNASRLIKQEWSNYFQECADKGISDPHILVCCHSQGAINVRNAGNSFDPALRKNIDVIAVAPGAHIQKNMFNDAIHFVSTDFVPWFDKYLLFGTVNSAPIVKLDRHPDAFFIDHAYNSPTYQSYLKESVDGYLNTYGRPL